MSILAVGCGSQALAESTSDVFGSAAWSNTTGSGALGQSPVAEPRNPDDQISNELVLGEPVAGERLTATDLVGDQLPSERPPVVPLTTEQVSEVRAAAAISPETQGTFVAHVNVDTIVARQEPSATSSPIEEFENPTPRGGPLVFAAVGIPTDGWLEVMLPIRPNGSTGWIPVDEVDLTINPFRIEVNASEHRMSIFRFGEEILTTTVAIGAGDTPTPIGEFFLIELLRPSDPTGVYGPFAYGLSGYSETLDNFNGGNGVIGIHGTNDPDALGGDVSHGCIRVANPTISEMTNFLPLGTPVKIFRTA